MTLSKIREVLDKLDDELSRIGVSMDANSLIKEAIKALDEHIEGGGWLPIEGIPEDLKDGTEILIHGGKRNDVVIMLHGWQGFNGYAVASYDCGNWEGGGYEYKPTHYKLITPKEK